MRTGTYLSLNEASKLSGRAKSTLSKALKNGKLSYVSKDEKTGAYKIDPAELLRVFPETPNSSNSDRKETHGKPHENSALETELKALRQEKITSLENQIEELKTERDEWRKQAQQLALQPPADNNPKGFFKRLFGG